MTRRPPMPPDGNIRRAHQRMAPGGRLWSESPVRGPAVRVAAAGDDPPPVAPVLPSVFDYGQDASTSGTRMAATINPLDTYSVAANTGDLVATVVITEAAVTPGADWTVLHSHTFTDFTYTVATIDSLSASPTATWAMDWTGVSGLGEWAYFTVWFGSGGGAAVSGLTWDLEYSDNDAATSGTFIAPTDPTWLYSVPALVQEDSEYSYSTPAYRTNSHGSVTSAAGSADTNAWTWFPRADVSPSSKLLLAETYEIGAVDQFAQIWAPDQAYDSSTAGYSGTPGNAPLLFGVKPNIAGDGNATVNINVRRLP